jgi:HD-GYP domain-containing protein (c-di-GMP phosphodiesterase class II)/ActR/RegA family two-component response regulator
MRKNKLQEEINDAYRLMIIDDDEGIIDSVSTLLRRMGYVIDGYMNPVEGLEQMRNEHYDLLVLDYFMLPMHGDEVVENIRSFDKELYILLLTGYKDLAPPIETIKMLDIQAYCEKSERLDQLLLLVESGIKSISQMRTIKKFRDGLNSILGAVPKIYQLQPIGSILEEILLRILPLLNSQDAFILVDNLAEVASAEKSIFRGIGTFNVDVQNFMKMLDPKLMEAIGTARTQPEIILMKDGVILPLINEMRKAIGVIYVSSRDVEEGIELLEIYAGQAASSINNAFLHSLVNVKNEELSRTYAQLKTRYMDTIEALRLAVDAKDVYTRGHSDRVAYFSTLIGKSYHLSETELETLRIGGVFHDIGKIGTADDILLKTDKLDKADFEEIKRHPMKGALILSAVSMFSDVVPIVRHHHERIDGKGYPDGLKGENIPLPARIIAVADAFDAMTSDRQYRLRLPLEEAIDQLRTGAGAQFDKGVVSSFLELIKQEDVIENINQHLSETSIQIP